MGRRRRLASGISCGRISDLRVFISRNFYRENLLDFKFTPSEGRFQGLKIFFYLYNANRTDTHHGLKNAVDKSDICPTRGAGTACETLSKPHLVSRYSPHCLGSLIHGGGGEAPIEC